MQLKLIIAIVTLMVALICLVDLWNKKCPVTRKLFWSPVPFIPFLGPLLYYALFDPPPVLDKKDAPAPENPIEQWKEWLANRYNPGYFTGGQIHPVYRAVGSKAGIFLLVSGTAGVVLMLFAMRSEGAEDLKSMLLFDAIISVVTIFAGLTIIAEGKKKKGKK